MDANERMAKQLHRARVHLSLLEKDATHPLDFAVFEAHSQPSLVLRPGEHLSSAHSEAHLGYELLREVIMDALRTHIEALSEKLGGTHPALSLDKMQYGDQTEA